MLRVTSRRTSVTESCPLPAGSDEAPMIGPVRPASDRVPRKSRRSRCGMARLYDATTPCQGSLDESQLTVASDDIPSQFHASRSVGPTLFAGICTFDVIRPTAAVGALLAKEDMCLWVVGSRGTQAEKETCHETQTLGICCDSRVGSRCGARLGTVCGR